MESDEAGRTVTGAVQRSRRSYNIQVGNTDPKLQEDWRHMLSRVREELLLAERPSDAKAARIVVDEINCLLDWQSAASAAKRLAGLQAMCGSLIERADALQAGSAGAPGQTLFRELSRAYRNMGQLAQRNIALESRLAELEDGQAADSDEEGPAHGRSA